MRPPPLIPGPHRMAASPEVTLHAYWLLARSSPLVPGRGSPSPWASSKTQPQAEHPDAGQGTQVWPRPSRWLPEPLSSPLSIRDPGPAEASGGVGSRQAAPPTRTLNQLSMTLLLEGHRLFLNTDVVTDVRVLEPQQLSCKDPACPRSARTGRWPRAAPHRCPSPVWWGALGQSPQGPPSVPSSCPAVLHRGPST